MTDSEGTLGGDDLQRTSTWPLRFLSTAWFNMVTEMTPPWIAPPGRSVVLEQVVEGTPAGTVRYRVEASSRACRIVWPVDPSAAQADLTIISSWDTAAAIASGEMNADAALTQGRLKVRGNPLAIDIPDGEGAFRDPVPSEVRHFTDFSVAGGAAMLGEPRPRR